MKTAVIGFPRIGALRELKFSSEKYFRNEITEEELLETGRTLRKTHWKIQKEAGIDYITSNDFSYYDIVLDTAFLLIIFPAMIFPIMMVSWMPLLCAELSQSVIRS